MLLFCVIYDHKWGVCVFGLLFGQKFFENITMNSGKMRWVFFTLFGHTHINVPEHILYRHRRRSDAAALLTWHSAHTSWEHFVWVGKYWHQFVSNQNLATWVSKSHGSYMVGFLITVSQIWSHSHCSDEADKLRFFELNSYHDCFPSTNWFIYWHGHLALWKYMQEISRT